jgi:aryl-phospho-beta-D-glucosidase BglC (GH1 family)
MNLGCGFNMTWMTSTLNRPSWALPAVSIDERELDFIAAAGFEFVRVPLDYRFWIHGFRYDRPIESRLRDVDRCVSAVVSRGLHCSLNIHRAPGYCINGPETEKHNLWTDGAAQDAFVAQWELFAARYRHIPHGALSFDLLNEPPAVGRLGMTRGGHEALIRRTVAAIRRIDPGRMIVVDGLAGGNNPLPELADLGVTTSGRGYQPMALTHFKADWCAATRSLEERPTYPGVYWEGVSWGKETLRAYYASWRKAEAAGTPVHIGEFGCYETVDNDVALRWFADLLSLYKEYGWGWALWNFRGPFGLVDHHRSQTYWETIHGFSVDRGLYELLLANRTAATGDSR